MKNNRLLGCLGLLMLLLAAGYPKERGEQPQRPEEKQEGEGVPALTAIPTGDQWREYRQNHGEEDQQAYEAQIYRLLSQCSPQQVADGLKEELESWSATVEGVSFPQVEIEVSQDPLLMGSGGDKRQFRNIAASIRMLYDPATIQGEEGPVMEPLLEEAGQVIRQSPYGLQLVSAELCFVAENTGYPNYFLSDVGVGTPDADEPSAHIPPEEQVLQTLAYEKVTAFCQETFAGELFAGLPYANMALRRFGVAQGSAVLECEVWILQAGEEGASSLAPKLETLAQEMASQWKGETEAIEALGITTAKVTFERRDSPDGTLVFEFPLKTA